MNVIFLNVSISKIVLLVFGRSSPVSQCVIVSILIIFHDSNAIVFLSSTASKSDLVLCGYW
jgi:hypothetical protein